MTDKYIFYANLTNGIELANNYHFATKVIRIQSTALEQKLYQRVIDELDYNFLYDLALGKKVIVMDCKSKSDEPTRAQWQGLPFIAWLLRKEWYDLDTQCIITSPRHKSLNVTKFAIEVYKTLDIPKSHKISYFKSVADTTKPFELGFFVTSTNRDGDRSILRDFDSKCNDQYTIGEIDAMTKGSGYLNI